MDELTELERLLYNKHLIVSRSLKNKPFKIKKDFSTIVATEKHKFLKRIATLIKKHPEIDPTTFFEAPYKLYPDVEYFGLDYFSTMRAVKAYTTYKKQIFLQNPDSQIESVKESLKFIARFCIENNISLHQYPNHRSSDVFAWMTHYKQNKINIYVMMEFPDIYSSVQTLAEDIRRFFVSEFIEQFKQLRSMYMSSKELQPYLKKALSTIDNFIYSELTKSKNNVI
jgi:hypothetical protein